MKVPRLNGIRSAPTLGRYGTVMAGVSRATRARDTGKYG